MTLTCPTCKLPHALFWRVGTKGDKGLCYRCDKQERFKDSTMVDRETGKPVVETVRVTATIPVIDFKLIAAAKAMTLPEEWTHGYRKAQQNKQQHQLLLMKHKEDRP